MDPWVHQMGFPVISVAQDRTVTQVSRVRVFVYSACCAYTPHQIEPRLLLRNYDAKVMHVVARLTAILQFVGKIIESRWFLLTMMVSLCLSSRCEEATEAICVGRIQTRLGVVFVSEFSAQLISSSSIAGC